jgi:hypothetical protein
MYDAETQTPRNSPPRYDASFQVKTMPMHTSTYYAASSSPTTDISAFGKFESERVEIYNFADATDD